MVSTCVQGRSSVAISLPVERVEEQVVQEDAARRLQGYARKRRRLEDRLRPEKVIPESKMGEEEPNGGQVGDGGDDRLVPVVTEAAQRVQRWLPIEAVLQRTQGATKGV